MFAVSEHLMTDILSTLGDVVDGPRINWKTAAVFLDLMQKDPKVWNYRSLEWLTVVKNFWQDGFMPQQEF